MSAHTPPRLARTTGRAAALLVALLLALSAVMFTSAPAEATSHSVTIKQYAYGPGALSIKQGDTVTWTNQDVAAHDVKVTSGPVSFQSPLLDQGESWSYTFTTAGSYSYICSVHPDMKGSVTAVAKAPAPATSAPTHVHSDAAEPAATDTHAATAPSQSAGVAPKKTKKAKASATPSAAPSPTELTTASQQPTTSLNPLLLVAGASIAVVVFCLLLMTSRPRVHTSKSTDSGEEA